KINQKIPSTSPPNVDTFSGNQFDISTPRSFDDLLPPPLFRGPAAVIPTDLVHIAIKLNLVAIKVRKLDGLIYARTFLLWRDDLYSLRPHFRCLLSQFVKPVHRVGDLLELHTSVLRAAQLLGRQLEKDRIVMIMAAP